MDEIKPETLNTPDEQKVKEFGEYLAYLQFVSDSVRYRTVIYQGIKDILERLARIEEKLKNKEY